MWARFCLFQLPSECVSILQLVRKTLYSVTCKRTHSVNHAREVLLCCGGHCGSAATRCLAGDISMANSFLDWGIVHNRVIAVCLEIMESRGCKVITVIHTTFCMFVPGLGLVGVASVAVWRRFVGFVVFLAMGTTDARPGECKWNHVRCIRSVCVQGTTRIRG